MTTLYVLFYVQFYLTVHNRFKYLIVMKRLYINEIV
jgi:hypothetical protein